MTVNKTGRLYPVSEIEPANCHRRLAELAGKSNLAEMILGNCTTTILLREDASLDKQLLKAEYHPD